MSNTADINQGDILSRLLRAHGVNMTELAREIRYYPNKKGVSRNTIYNWFGEEVLSSEKILAVSRAIVRMPQSYPGLTDEIETTFPHLQIGAVVIEERSKYAETNVDDDCMRQINHWRSKYIATMERVNELQSELLALRSSL